ncbi:hypothetical protein DFH29DRAFT_879505 [Suillus ampliporus]|nr:hypothetical protein DFH29DRAFT_879505 [Suillus ampliporus]
MKYECHAKEWKAELEALTPLMSQYMYSLGAIVGQLLQTIQETTSWYESIYLEGPDPHVARDVYVFSFHHRKRSTGLSFRKALPDHYTCVVELFTMFLKGAFATQVLLPQPNTTTNSVLSDVTLPGETQMLHTLQDQSIVNLHSVAIIQYLHTFFIVYSVLPNKIHQLPQDQSFNNSLGLFGTSLEPFIMSDDTLYEANFHILLLPVFMVL